MIILQKPLLEHEMQYREMISEWRGNKPYTPCIIDFNCNTDDFNYKDTLKVVNDYRMVKFLTMMLIILRVLIFILYLMMTI